MSALYLSIAATGNDQVVRRPHPADAIGAALLGTYGAQMSVPTEIARLMERLDRLS